MTDGKMLIKGICDADRRAEEAGRYTFEDLARIAEAEEKAEAYLHEKELQREEMTA